MIMKEKMKQVGRIVQLVVAVLFVFTGILFWDDSREFHRYVAWLLFGLGAANAAFFGLWSSDKSTLAAVLSSANAIGAFIVVYLLFKGEKSLMGTVWSAVGLVYGGMAAWLIFKSKKESSDSTSHPESGEKQSGEA
jgi:hypothetical protein